MNLKKKLFRIDELLVLNEICANIAEAKAFIMAGKVIVNDQRCDSAALKFNADAHVRLKNQSRFVSRGGDKILSAIEQLCLSESFKNKVILDVGASTGGFTDCMLQHGAKTVIALDVGTNQLAWKLRQNTQVISLEKTDIRQFDKELYPPIDWIIGDISFNSIVNLAEHIINAGTNDTYYLLLIKPQFELSAEEIPDGGIVQDPKLISKAMENVKIKLQQLDLDIISFVNSKIKGRFGNQEIFIWFKHKAKL